VNVTAGLGHYPNALASVPIQLSRLGSTDEAFELPFSFWIINI
jgi:hypothetical protein